MVENAFINNLETSQYIGELHRIMKQYFYLVTSLVDGDRTPLRIFLQPKNAIKFGRTFAEKNQGALVSLYKQPISNSGEVTWICNLNPWNYHNPEVEDIPAEEMVLLSNACDLED